MLVLSPDEFRQLDTAGSLADDLGGCGTTQRHIRLKSLSLNLLQTPIQSVELVETIEGRVSPLGVVRVRPDDLDRILAAEVALILAVDQ